MRALAEACTGGAASSLRAESHARLAFRARVPSFAGAEECKELLRTPFPPSSTRPGRSSCRWPRKVRVEPHAHLAPNVRLTHRALRSRVPFGARAPRPASNAIRCPGRDPPLRPPPPRVLVKVMTKSTASRAHLAEEVLQRAGFVLWRSGARQRRLAARRRSEATRSVVRRIVGWLSRLAI